MHDLRHSLASLLINSGRTLYEVQHILGHTQIKTTQRYAHLSQDTLLAAAKHEKTPPLVRGGVAKGVIRPNPFQGWGCFMRRSWRLTKKSKVYRPSRWCRSEPLWQSPLRPLPRR